MLGRGHTALRQGASEADSSSQRCRRATAHAGSKQWRPRVNSKNGSGQYEEVGTLHARQDIDGRRAGPNLVCLIELLIEAVFGDGAAQAATCATALAMSSTIVSIRSLSSPSPMTRMTGSVPDGRITSRPWPWSRCSALAIAERASAL